MSLKTVCLFLVILTITMISCGEVEIENSDNTKVANQQEKISLENEVEIIEEAPEVVEEELSAINDETKKSEGAVECITQQFALIKEGKFDEALEYYSAKRKALVIEELTENPAIKDEWKEAIESIPEEYYKTMIESIKENPEFFVFEDGMWRRTDK